MVTQEAASLPAAQHSYLESATDTRAGLWNSLPTSTSWAGVCPNLVCAASSACGAWWPGRGWCEVLGICFLLMLVCNFTYWWVLCSGFLFPFSSAKTEYIVFWNETIATLYTCNPMAGTKALPAAFQLITFLFHQNQWVYATYTWYGRIYSPEQNIWGQIWIYKEIVYQDEWDEGTLITGLLFKTESSDEPLWSRNVSWRTQSKDKQQCKERQNPCRCLLWDLLYSQLVKPGAEEGKLQEDGMCLTLISDEERQDVQLFQLCSTENTTCKLSWLFLSADCMRCHDRVSESALRELKWKTKSGIFGLSEWFCMAVLCPLRKCL